MKAMSGLKCECGGDVLFESRAMNLAICTRCKKRYTVKEAYTGKPEFKEADNGNQEPHSNV